MSLTLPNDLRLWGNEVFIISFVNIYFNAEIDWNDIIKKKSRDIGNIDHWIFRNIFHDLSFI